MVRTANPALLKPLNLSSELEAVVGKGPMSRGQVVKQIWVYIKKHDLQNPKNKRNILADDKLKPLFGGKDIYPPVEPRKHARETYQKRQRPKRQPYSAVGEERHRGKDAA